MITPLLDTEGLIDSSEVTEILGLSSCNSVSIYQWRYADMPRPAVERGPGRTKSWLRAEVNAWAASRIIDGESHGSSEHR